MKDFVIYPYSRKSQGARAIAEGLGGRLWDPSDEYKDRAKIINWGSGAPPRGAINERTSQASNKISFFQNVSKSARTPLWTTSRDEAKTWVKKGNIVVARETVTGSAGKGIIIVKPGDRLDMPYAPLYTMYIPKDSEWRLHIMKGEVIHSQQKVPRDDSVAPTGYVMSHDNGYVFKIGHGGVPRDVGAQAIAAFKHSGLDFGAFDVITKEGKAYVLEANTAPGCTRGNSTARAYCAAFERFYG